MHEISTHIFQENAVFVLLCFCLYNSVAKTITRQQQHTLQRICLCIMPDHKNQNKNGCHLTGLNEKVKSTSKTALPQSASLPACITQTTLCPIKLRAPHIGPVLYAGVVEGEGAGGEKGERGGGRRWGGGGGAPSDLSHFRQGRRLLWTD